MPHSPDRNRHAGRIRCNDEADRTASEPTGRAAADTIIQVATPADVPALQQCARAAYARYVERIGREPAPMLADFSTLVAAGQVRIAWRAGRFAGYVVVEPRQDELHLDGIAILPELAGSGLGRRLVSAVEEEAGRLGLAKVTLYTNASMFENLTLYPHLGYHETDRRRENGFDRVYFEKILS